MIKLQVYIGLLVLFITGCFGFEEIPPPTLEDIYGEYLFVIYPDDYLQDTVVRNGTVRLTGNGHTLSIEFDYDTMDTYTLVTQEVTILRSGVSFNIPEHRFTNEELQADFTITGEKTHEIKGTTWFDGYAYKDSFVDFSIRIDYLDPAFSSYNQQLFISAHHEYEEF